MRVGALLLVFTGVTLTSKIRYLINKWTFDKYLFILEINLYWKTRGLRQEEQSSVYQDDKTCSWREEGNEDKKETFNILKTE